MRDYGKVSTSLWNSRKFQSLETPEARLVYLYLHTCPHVNSVGCFVLPVRYGAADTGLDLSVYQSALIALSKALLIGWDDKESVVRIIGFLEHDPFTNRNHALGSIRLARKLPECEQKSLVFKDIDAQSFVAVEKKTDSPIEGVSNPLNPEPGTQARKKEDTYVSLSDPAFDLFNEFASKAGWPSCQTRGKGRVSAIVARVKEAGGLDGWRIALEKAEASDFLCNRTKAGFTATIDFILQKSSFTKLMEGNYDNRTGNTNGTGRNGSSAHDKLMAGFAAVADQEQRREGFDFGTGDGTIPPRASG